MCMTLLNNGKSDKTEIKSNQRKFCDVLTRKNQSNYPK